MSPCLVTLLAFGVLGIPAVLVAIYLNGTAKNRCYAAGSADGSTSSPQLDVLAASAFPKRADIYKCDDCERDITKYLHPGRAHVWRAMGPERFQCTCGRIYLTGATEWDHLGDWERRNRISQTIGLGILFSAMASILGLLVYLVFYFGFGCKEAAITALSIAVLPFVLMQVTFWPFVAASIWRTRVGTSIEVGKK
jgi:hypothetical protein